MCCKTIETIFFARSNWSFRVLLSFVLNVEHTKRETFGNEVLGSSRTALFLENWQMAILSIESSTDSSFYVFRALVTTTPSTISSTTIRKSHDKWTFVSIGSTERLPIFVPPTLSIHICISTEHLNRFIDHSLVLYTYVRVVCVYIICIRNSRDRSTSVSIATEFNN